MKVLANDTSYFHFTKKELKGKFFLGPLMRKIFSWWKFLIWLFENMNKAPHEDSQVAQFKIYWCYCIFQDKETKYKKFFFWNVQKENNRLLNRVHTILNIWNRRRIIFIKISMAYFMQKSTDAKLRIKRAKIHNY